MNRNVLTNTFFIFGLALLTFSCNGPSPNNMPTSVPVTLKKVNLEEAVYFNFYPGNIIAVNEVDISSEVSGFITDISFQEGQLVSRGQKLYEIEQSKYAAAYAQASANLKIAKANLDKAKNDAQRYNELGQKGMATKQKQEYSQTDLENAESQVAAAEAELLKAETDLKHATIVAPFDGTIGISLVKKGAFVTGGQTKLNTVSSNDPIAVDFAISEKEINRYLELEKRKYGKNDSTFTIILPDKSIYKYPGKILFLDRAVDRQTGTLKVRLNFPNPGRALRAGMSCNIRVQNKNANMLPVVPQKSITEQMGEFFVYVVEKDTARQHKVKLGPTIGDNVIVYTGLNGGEDIVVDGVQKLRDGAAVQAGAPTNQAALNK